MRVDVEGSEYSLLPDLAASGVARWRPSLYLAVEWHRHNKQASLPRGEAALMGALDRSMGHFNRAVAPSAFRAYLPLAAQIAENYEKELVLRLARANVITPDYLRARSHLGSPLGSRAPIGAPTGTPGATAERASPRFGALNATRAEDTVPVDGAGRPEGVPAGPAAEAPQHGAAPPAALEFPLERELAMLF